MFRSLFRGAPRFFRNRKQPVSRGCVAASTHPAGQYRNNSANPARGNPAATSAVTVRSNASSTLTGPPPSIISSSSGGARYPPQASEFRLPSVPGAAEYESKGFEVGRRAQPLDTAASIRGMVTSTRQHRWGLSPAHRAAFEGGMERKFGGTRAQKLWLHEAFFADDDAQSLTKKQEQRPKQQQPMQVPPATVEPQQPKAPQPKTSNTSQWRYIKPPQKRMQQQRAQLQRRKSC